MKNEMVLDRAQAELEFQNWADHKRLRPHILADLNEEKEKIVTGLMYGVFELDEKHNLLHHLGTPLEGTDTLTYKPNITVSDVESIKGKTEFSRGAGMLAKIADVNVGVIKKLNTNDMAEGSSVAAFYFLG